MTDRDDRRAKLWERLGWLECNYEDWGEFNANLRAELEASERDIKTIETLTKTVANTSRRYAALATEKVSGSYVEGFLLGALEGIESSGSSDGASGALKGYRELKEQGR